MRIHVILNYIIRPCWCNFSFRDKYEPIIKKYSLYVSTNKVNIICFKIINYKWGNCFVSVSWFLVVTMRPLLCACEVAGCSACCVMLRTPLAGSVTAKSFDTKWSVTRSYNVVSWVPGIFLGVNGDRRVRIQLHRHLWADFLENVEALTSHNPMYLHGLLQG
jgi:hypothetical protein